MKTFFYSILIYILVAALIGLGTASAWAVDCPPGCPHCEQEAPDSNLLKKVNTVSSCCGSDVHRTHHYIIAKSIEQSQTSCLNGLFCSSYPSLSDEFIKSSSLQKNKIFVAKKPVSISSSIEGLPLTGIHLKTRPPPREIPIYIFLCSYII